MTRRFELLGHTYNEQTISKSGIYIIVNKETGSVYVGSAKEFKRRWNKHISEFLSKKHNNSRLLKVWEKYGNTKLMWIIAEICDSEKLLEREQAWLDLMRELSIPLYNIKLIANSRLGLKCSEETRLKMSLAARSRKMLPQSMEHKRKISESNKGRVKSENERKAIRLAKLGNSYNKSRKWVHTETQNKRIKLDELSEYLSSGWALGRLPLSPYKS